MRHIFLFFLLCFSFSYGVAAETGFKSLLNVSRTIVYKDGRSKEVVDNRYRVTTSAGAVELSNYRLRYPALGSKFKLLKAEVKNDNSVVRVSAQDIRMSTLTEGTAGLFEVQEVVIPFSQVKPGSEVQVKYQIEREPVLKGVFGIQGGIANGVIADEEAQIFLSDLPLRHLTRDFEDVYVLKERKLGRRYEVEIRPTEKARLLSGKKLKVGYFALSTAPSWLQLNKEFSRRYEEAINKELPKPMVDIVESAKAEKDTKRRLELVASRLKKLITYSGNWLTAAGSFFPAGHEKVIENAKGDCKDYSAAMATILRSLGYQAHVALTFRSDTFIGEEAVKELATLPNHAPFNHAIVQVREENGKTWWIDPTNPIVLADVLGHDLLGNLALVLDGQSEGVEILPRKNAIVAETRIDQTVDIKADNRVEVTGKMTMNPTAFNGLGIVEQLHGPEMVKKVIAAQLNPKSNSTLEYEKEEGQDQIHYTYKLTAGDWVEEKKFKSASVDIFHPGTLYLLASASGAAADFRGEGSLQMVTRVKKRNAVDPIRHDCFGRSPWLDIDRTVENMGEDIVITDHVTVKERYVPRKMEESEEFLDLVARLKECGESFRIVTFLDPSQKTSEEASLDELRGPPVEKMTASDADALESLRNIDLRRYTLHKLMRYYRRTIAKNPSDKEAHAQLALQKVSLGYLRGESHLPAYLDDAMNDVIEGLKKSPDHPKLLAAKIRINLYRNNYNEARRDFQNLQVKAPRSFDTYMMGFHLNEKMKNFPDAEKWLRLAGSVAAGDRENTRFHLEMGRLFTVQDRHREAIQHYEELLKKPNANAWDWHNAALCHCSLLDFDKCIEYEKKAISLSDFPLARRALAEALLRKAESLEIDLTSKKDLSAGEKGKREEDIERLILEAIRWDDENINAYQAILKFLGEIYDRSPDPAVLNKAKFYLTKALALKPGDAETLNLAKAFETRGKKNRQPAADKKKSGSQFSE